MGLGKNSSNYIISSLIAVAILGGFLLYNSPDAEAIPIGFPPTDDGVPQEWTFVGPGAAWNAVSDDDITTFLLSASNNDVSCFVVDTGLSDTVQFNGGVTLQVLAEKTVAKGQTKIRLGTNLGGVFDEGKSDFRLKIDASTHERFFADIDTAGEVHEREWCVFHQTDAKESHIFEIKVIAEVPDVTPPTLTGSLDIPANANGWHNQDVTVTWTCVDNPGGSGVDTLIPPTETYTMPDTPSFDFVSTCTDFAGNFATETINIKFDETPPDVTGLPTEISDQAPINPTDDGCDLLTCQADGLDGSIVTYTTPTTATDNLSGPDLSTIACTLASGSLFPINLVTVDPLDVTTVACTVDDLAGNTGTNTFDVTIFPYLAFDIASYQFGFPVILTVSDPAQSGSVSVRLSASATSCIEGVCTGGGSIDFVLDETATPGVFQNPLDEDGFPDAAAFVGAATNQADGVVHASDESQGFAQYPPEDVGVVSFAGPVEITPLTADGAQVLATDVDPIRFSTDIIEIEGFAGVTVFARTGSIYSGVAAGICLDDTVVETMQIEIFEKLDTGNSFLLTLTERDADECVFDSLQQFQVSKTINTGASPPTLKIPANSIAKGQVPGFGLQRGLQVTGPNVLPAGGTTFATNNLDCLVGTDTDNDGICGAWELGAGGGDPTTGQPLRIPFGANNAEHVWPPQGDPLYLNQGCTNLLVDERNPPSTGHPIYSDPRNPVLCFEPDKPDVAIEITPLRGHRAYYESLLRVIDAYQNAPPDGPDCIGCPGPTNLHIYLKNTIPFHLTQVPWDAAQPGFCGTGNDQCTAFPAGGYKQIRDEFFGTERERSGSDCPGGPPSVCTQFKEDVATARHQVWRHLFAGHDQSENPQSSGRSEIPGDDMMVTLGKFQASIGSITQQAGTYMHEIGHANRLNHGGAFDNQQNCKANHHYSVMNYLYQFRNFDPDRILDFSGEKLNNLQENLLVESVGIQSNITPSIPAPSS